MKTYEEVKKAMQIHANRGECTECPYVDLPTGNCINQMLEDAIELMNKYKQKDNSAPRNKL